MSFISEKNGEMEYTFSSAISAVNAFTTKKGGVSGGVYESLDLRYHSDDDIENVRENYRRMMSALGIGRIVYLRQIHSTNILTVTEKDALLPAVSEAQEGDGLLTDVPGLALAVFSADCIPILLHDPVRGVIGAVHAGWRGTCGGIAKKAVEKMCREFGCEPEDIRAAVGPGIGACCYEVGQEVADGLYAVLGDAAASFARPVGGKSGKYMADLKGANRKLLEEAGVARIDVSDECTMCRGDRYWSHRRDGDARGVQAAVIMLKGSESH